MSLEKLPWNTTCQQGKAGMGDTNLEKSNSIRRLRSADYLTGNKMLNLPVLNYSH